MRRIVLASAVVLLILAAPAAFAQCMTCQGEIIYNPDGTTTTTMSCGNVASGGDTCTITMTTDDIFSCSASGECPAGDPCWDYSQPIADCGPFDLDGARLHSRPLWQVASVKIAVATADPADRRR